MFSLDACWVIYDQQAEHLSLDVLARSVFSLLCYKIMARAFLNLH